MGEPGALNAMSQYSKTSKNILQCACTMRIYSRTTLGESAIWFALVHQMSIDKKLPAELYRVLSLRQGTHTLDRARVRAYIFVPRTLSNSSAVRSMETCIASASSSCSATAAAGAVAAVAAGLTGKPEIIAANGITTGTQRSSETTVELAGSWLTVLPSKNVVLYNSIVRTPSSIPHPSFPRFALRTTSEIDIATSSAKRVIASVYQR